MSWWACLWLALVASMLASWMIGPPVSYGGLLLWYLYDMFPVEKPYLGALLWTRIPNST